ncbi:hypothetical protein GGR51DRAFT_560724 [Nemania sp. FL0031]|nr:hypothetical protein GGR51DRAFT_560724 [Nemania sp. FL0031]
MSPKAADDSLDSLKALVQSSTRLVTQLTKNLYSVAYSSETSPGPVTPPPARDDGAGSIDAFSLAHDAASLIKAHTTKLSLLIINEPFTPSAISKVLRELVSGPVPAIASAVQHCTAETYTTVVRKELASRCYAVLLNLGALVNVVPLDGKILSTDRKNGSSGGRGSIVDTGLVWAACDETIRLKKLGVAGLLVEMANGYKEILEDSLTELKEWSEELTDEDEEDEEEEDHDVEQITSELQNTQISAQQMVDDLMQTPRIPRNDPDRIRERLDSCLKRLRLTVLLYSAIIKRRIKTLPPLPTEQATSIVPRLDEVYPILKRLPRSFDSAALAFYDLDPTSIDRTTDECFFDTFKVAEILKAPWAGTQDEFTEWASKFQTSIKKPDWKIGSTSIEPDSTHTQRE